MTQGLSVQLDAQECPHSEVGPRPFSAAPLAEVCSAHLNIPAAILNRMWAKRNCRCRIYAVSCLDAPLSASNPIQPQDTSSHKCDTHVRCRFPADSEPLSLPYRHRF